MMMVMLHGLQRALIFQLSPDSSNNASQTSLLTLGIADGDGYASIMLGA